MALKRNTEVDNRWHVIALDDDAPFRIAAGDWSESEADEWARYEAKLSEYIVCRFRDFNLTLKNEDIEKGNK